MSAQKRGFTLVELLVVISIIAVLATIGMTIYTSAQKSARIAKRIQDLQAIQTALELYYNVNKSYPRTDNVANNNGWRSECPSWVGVSADQVIPGLVPTYMITLPADPSMNKTNNTSCYLYNSNGNDYKLLDHWVSEFSLADYQSQRNLVDPRRDGGPDDGSSTPFSCDGSGDGTTIWSWSVYTEGAHCW